MVTRSKMLTSVCIAGLAFSLTVSDLFAVPVNVSQQNASGLSPQLGILGGQAVTDPTALQSCGTCLDPLSAFGVQVSKENDILRIIGISEVYANPICNRGRATAAKLNKTNSNCKSNFTCTITFKDPKGKTTDVTMPADPVKGGTQQWFCTASGTGTAADSDCKQVANTYNEECEFAPIK